jgi:CBS domain-containing protein
MSSFLDFFNVTIGTITESKHSLIEIKSSLTILETLVLMRENNISVVPVYEPPSSMSTVQYVSQGKEYIGLISLNDIVTFIINVYLNEAERIDDCFSTSVYEILGVTTESSIDRPLSIESENTPLSSVIDKLCQGSLSPPHTHTPSINSHLFCQVCIVA